MRRTVAALVAALALVAAPALAGCAGTVPDGSASAGDTSPSTAPPATVPATTPPPTLAPSTGAVPDGDGTTEVPRPSRPAWLGRRPLPLDEQGFGQVQPTPPELVDRRLPTVDVLPPPPDDGYHASVATVPVDVLARSTWSPACPVAAEDLRYVTISFWGFDGGHHTGELLVHAEVAEDLVTVFGRLHEARFPLEEVRITRADELDLHPTGDGNTTGAFVCRPSVGSTTWSQHAHGLAVDVNPFHNPYSKGELVLPELASAYLDRSDVRPGMVLPGDVVTTAFADIGWGWGGGWTSSSDPMHFSRSGR